MKRLLLFGILLLVMGIVGVVTAQEDEAETTDSPIGQWVSIACELRPGPQYLTRDFTIEEGSWVGDILIYADPACTIPTVLLHIEGQIAFGDALPVADGVVETDFSGEVVTFTPLVEDMVGFLNTAEAGTCGSAVWELNVEQSVSETGGCSLFGLEVPFTEHDITLVRDGYLFAGARPLDGSGFPDPDNRATALQVPLVRVDEGE